ALKDKGSQQQCHEKEKDKNSEDEKKIKYMNSDAESDVSSVKDKEMPQNLEIPRRDYIQPDMKEWIPVNANTVLPSLGTVRTVEDELEASTTQSGFGRVRSENSKCSKVRLGLVRNTVLNRLGNMERTYVGLKPDAVQNQ
ncbi:hypothetical protein M9458_011141, partial [Cirrhinus mrigala]